MEGLEADKGPKEEVEEICGSAEVEEGPERPQRKIRQAAVQANARIERHCRSHSTASAIS